MNSPPNNGKPLSNTCRATRCRPRAAISTSTRRTAKITLETHRKISYNQTTMNEQKTIEEENLPGVPLLLGPGGKVIRALTPEEYERAHKNFDEEFMCDKDIASLLRRCREQQKKKS